MDATASTAGRDAALGREAVVGREAELDRIDAFLARREELPAGLLIEGPAGAGKTTLWRAGVNAAAAAGYLVLTCRPAGAEVQLAYAALSDLLEPGLEAALPSLPRPQRRALEMALLLADHGGHTPDRRAIAAGTLNALRALATERPVVLAVDDAQWVDAPSAEVLEFAIRRLGDAPVAILASRRLPSPTADAPAGGLRPDRAIERPTARIEVGPLSLGATHRLLRLRTAAEFNRRTLQRIHETSGGNPFYALELARSLAGAGDESAGAVGGAGPGGTEPLALSVGLQELLAGRIAGLGEGTRSALFVIAALTQPTDVTVASATSQADDALAADLAPAIRAGIVHLTGRDAAGNAIEFGHPLLAAAAYAGVDLTDRRRWHARIADVATDRGTRARHLALARPGQDTEVAGLLLEAARDALGRGAPGVAAELFGEAIDRLPPDADPRTRALWSVEAAPLFKLAGASDRAIPLVEAAVASLSPGPDRSAAKRMLGDLVESQPGGFQRSIQLVDEAIEEAGSDARRLAAALLDREMLERSSARLDLALPIARQALAAAYESSDLELEAHAEVRVADLEVLQGLGGDDAIARFARAEELDRQVHVDAESSAPVMLAVCLIRLGRLDEARPRLLDGRKRAAAEGDESSEAQICLFLAELEWLAGHWDAAAAFAEEGLQVAEQSGNRVRHGATTGLLALVEASRGEPGRARAIAERAISICVETGDIGYERYARQVLASLELALGNAAAAAASLDTYVVGHAIEGPKRIAFIGDVIEALVQLGRLEEAADLTAEVAARGSQLKRRPMTATADRGDALVRAAHGDQDGAIAAAGRSIAAFDDLGHPFERARSMLVLGEIQRRARQRRTARETLTDAMAAFEALGAHLWRARAEAERARIGGRSSIEGLSETELRVAQLVAEGRTNKEVAAALFVSVRAVESNLSKVYAKLGIESRTELARRI